MTSEEFLKALPKDGWTLTHLGYIRRLVQVGDDTVNCCPITSINCKSATQFELEGKKLGLDGALVHDITSAADNVLNRPNLYDLRQKLLKVTGLL
jgi:hypothetical protein